MKFHDPYDAEVYTGFDGSGTFPPEPAMRTLTDRMFTLKDLFRMVSDQDFACENGLGPWDIKKIKEALRAHRDQGDKDKSSGDMRKFTPGVAVIRLGF